MKKILFIIPLVVVMITTLRVPVKADTIRPFATSAGYVVRYNSNNGEYWIRIHYISFIDWEFSSVQNHDYDNSFRCGDIVASREFRSLEDCVTYFNEYVQENPYGSYQFYDEFRYDRVTFDVGSNYTFYVYNVPYRYVPTGADVNDVTPSEPEPVDNWFRNMWDFVMDTLGITDDFSNDLYDWMIEGDDGEGGHSGGHGFEYVTPTPTPTPTPMPTPTPYYLNIVDNDGNPVYTITGIPSQNITINNTTNNESGDGFDIFEVDVKLLPSGGVSNPKDGLNSVMDSNLEVLEDIDVTPVGASFSVLPSDWFIMLGAIICMPFIAGFISKLLK